MTLVFDVVCEFLSLGLQFYNRFRWYNNTQNNINKALAALVRDNPLSVKNCDNIFVIENGQVKEQGNFEELLKNSETFHKMVRPNN